MRLGCKSGRQDNSSERAMLARAGIYPGNRARASATFAAQGHPSATSQTLDAFMATRRSSLNLSDMSIAEYTLRLASSDPTPGGGSAAAAVGALGAALVQMVAGLTLASPKFSGPSDQLQQIQKKAE